MFPDTQGTADFVKAGAAGPESPGPDLYGSKLNLEVLDHCSSEHFGQRSHNKEGKSMRHEEKTDTFILPQLSEGGFLLPAVCLLLEIASRFHGSGVNQWQRASPSPGTDGRNG